MRQSNSSSLLVSAFLLVLVTAAFLTAVVLYGYQDQVTMRVRATVYTRIGEPITTATNVSKDAWLGGKTPNVGDQFHHVGVTGLFGSGYPFRDDYEVLAVRRVTLLQMIGLQ